MAETTTLNGQQVCLHVLSSWYDIPVVWYLASPWCLVWEGLVGASEQNLISVRMPLSLDVLSAINGQCHQKMCWFVVNCYQDCSEKNKTRPFIVVCSLWDASLQRNCPESTSLFCPLLANFSQSGEVGKGVHLHVSWGKGVHHGGFDFVASCLEGGYWVKLVWQFGNCQLVSRQNHDNIRRNEKWLRF